MRILALDIGTKRIGVAYADTSVRIAVPRGMIPVDGNELSEIERQFRLEKADIIVSGLPRNNSGEETRQTESVHLFINQLMDYFKAQGQAVPRVYFQDESWTSVEAEQHFAATHHEISRQDRKDGKIDTEAAAIILQDFLEGADLAQIEAELKEESWKRRA